MRTGIAAGAIAVLLVGGIGAGIVLTHNNATTTGSGGTNNPSVTGCPGSVSDVQWSQPASATLTLINASAVTNIAGGSIFAVELPSGYVWSYDGSSGGTINAQDPAGSYRSTTKTCEWRFTAPTASGTYILSFVRRCLPASNKICSDIAISYRLGIKVGS